MKTYYRHTLVSSSIFLVTLLLLLSCRHSDINEIQSEVRRISTELVPDQRTCILTANVKPGPGKIVIINGETTSLQGKQSLIKTLNDKGINLIDSIKYLPDSTNNNKVFGLVNLSVINLRKQPDQRSELVSQSILGTPVLILKEAGSWLLIQTPDNYIAWTENSSIERLDRSELNQWKESERIIFTENSGWIYCQADESCIVGDLVSGCIMVKTGEVENWVAVKLPDGREGVVNKITVENFNDFMKKGSATGENIEKKAAALTGVPYLWGGSSSKGMDCSGFVQTVFFINGLILQRDASLQAMHGVPVDISSGSGQLEKGDLLFFGSREHITHVAIYIGDTEFIHSSGRVMINSLDSTRTNFSRYRKSTFVKALRIIGSHEDGIVKISEHSWY